MNYAHVRPGLSPLARGTLVPCRTPCLPLRFIPAGAGNTAGQRGFCFASPVYPRWRGEHMHNANLSAARAGLSPLARGTPFSSNSAPSEYRFIPAGAGNTGQRRIARTSGSVYPRWRGEHAISRNTSMLMRGLSPLARGTPRLMSYEIFYFRFIPAGAGNTINVVFGIGSYTVYPRWRGEHRTLPSCTSQIYGLSPLARGTPIP
ncbi:hypothetical protein PEC301937_26960 [Pectobacterium carotovorum subsp. carotovorum]|nr:hypothetical protein PEC301937_26960 [Pectobacterium carotovorum subsp. carotovorum]